MQEFGLFSSFLFSFYLCLIFFLYFIIFLFRFTDFQAVSFAKQKFIMHVNIFKAGAFSLCKSLFYYLELIVFSSFASSVSVKGGTVSASASLCCVAIVSWVSVRVRSVGTVGVAAGGSRSISMADRGEGGRMGGGRWLDCSGSGQYLNNWLSGC